MIANRASEAPRRRFWRGAGTHPAGEQRGVLLAAILMFVFGWGALLYLVLTTKPRIGGELWLFFILLQVAVTGTAIPLARWVSILTLRQAPPTGVLVRRGVWIGFIAVICAWLMIPRYFSLTILLVLILIFAAIEIFLRNRELVNER